MPPRQRRLPQLFGSYTPELPEVFGAWDDEDEEEQRRRTRERLADIRARGDIGTTDVSDPEVTGLRSLLYGAGATEKGVARDKAAVADLGFGWAVGGAEKLGLVPGGTRAELRAAHEEAQDAYLTAHPEGGLGRAVVEAGRSTLAGLAGPQAALGPGLAGLAARGATALGAGRAAAVAAGAVGGAAEGAGQGLLDTVDLEGDERARQVLLGTALGTIGGAAASRGAAAGARAAGEAPLAGPRRAIAETIAPELRAERRALERAAEVDPLTGLANRRALDKALPAAEADPGMAVVVFDANNFGQVNKRVGQEAGDQLLEEVAGAVRKAADEQGVGGRVFRRGGDEIVVLAPADVAETVRARAEELFGAHTYRAGEPDQFTVSLTGTAGRTFGEADSTLQAAKAARKAREAPLDSDLPPAPPARVPVFRGGPPGGFRRNFDRAGTPIHYTSDPAEAAFYASPRATGQDVEGFVQRAEIDPGEFLDLRDLPDGPLSREVVEEYLGARGVSYPGGVTAPSRERLWYQINDSPAFMEAVREAGFKGYVLDEFNPETGGRYDAVAVHPDFAPSRTRTRPVRVIDEERRGFELEQPGIPRKRTAPGGAPEGLPGGTSPGVVRGGPEGPLSSEAFQSSPRGERAAGNPQPSPEGIVPDNMPAVKSTSTANAVTAAEREARGLPEVEVEARRTLGDSWELAQQRLVEDPLAGHKLAGDLAKKPRTASAEENALLLRDRMRIQTEHRAALAAEEAAADAGDQAALAAAKVRRMAVEAALDTNDQAARRAGYEWGLAGRARQMAIREDYSFATLYQRAKGAVRGSVRLTPDEVEVRLQPVRENLATMADRLVEAETNLRLYQEAAQERRAARVLKREAVVARRLAGRSGREVAVGDLASEFEVLRADFRAKAATPRAGLDPDLASVVYRMARNRVRAGVNSLEQVVADVHAAVRDAVDLEPADIRDAIADGGAPKAPRQVAPDAKRMQQLREEARLVRILEAAEQGRPIPTKGGKPRTLPPPELAALREQVREVLERHGIGPGSEPARLAALKKRLQAAAERERVTIATGERPPARTRRPPPEFDEEAIRLQAEVVRLRRDADTVIRNLELQNRTGLEKAIDWTVGWGRAIKLSSIATATKLVSSGIARTFVFNPLRHVAGAPLTRLPGRYGRLVRERAPIEGGFSGEALVKSWARFFSKDTRAAIWGHLARMEEDPLTLAHGGHSYMADSVKALDTVPKPMQYIAHLLAAYEDVPVKYSAYQYAISKMEKFQRAMEAQGAEILARGGDLTDPLEQLNAQAHAFEYATRQVFMQNDRVVSAFRRLVDRKPGDDAEKQLLKGLIETQLPILKVPLNMAKERLEYFGPVSLAHGLLRLRRAVKAGVDTIPYDVGDSIVREIKHGSMGTAAALLGWYGYEHFGGYRTPLRPKSDEPHEGEIEVFGVTIPRGLADHPLLMQMQFFATMRKMAERYGKGEFFSEGTGRGVAAAALGTAKSVPFYDVPFESGKSLENSVSGRGRGVQGFVGAYERGMALPPDVQRRARIQDQRDEPSPGEQVLQQLGLQRIEARRRTPDDLWEEFLMGVPGARNTVR